MTKALGYVLAQAIDMETYCVVDYLNSTRMHDLVAGKKTFFPQGKLKDVRLMALVMGGECGVLRQIGTDFLIQ